ncbi:Nitrilotriacetate monooxygenase component A [Marinibacterium anthonyi]|nr:Nitrilotriacetate monooxygenase component A [Marinibacterium anthonyi]
MTAPRQIHLGVSMIGYGYHLAGWRHPDVETTSMSLDHYVRVLQTAERGLFDMGFLADGVGIRFSDEPSGALSRSGGHTHFEPLTLLSALSMVTRNIGLVATASTTYNEPYHVARKFASLDHLSGGRAGWNVVTSATDLEARNFGRDSALESAKRYDRAAEFVEVVRGLWDSWEDDAFVRDKDSGVYFDPAKAYILDHKGPHFQVKGPLNATRSPQGHPVIVQAGASDQGRELAAATADVVYAASPVMEHAQAYYADVKGRMARYGRHPDELKIMPGFMAVPGASRAEAEEHYEQLQELVHPLVGLGALSSFVGDLSGHPLDGPLPDEMPNTRMSSRGKIFVDIARSRGLTIRELYLSIAGGNGHYRLIGTPKDIVDEMQAWVEAGAADGFNILPTHLPAGLGDVVDQVVPELQRRGLYRTEYRGGTLRENLGLKRPDNRLAARRAAVANAAADSGV